MSVRNLPVIVNNTCVACLQIELIWLIYSAENDLRWLFANFFRKVQCNFSILRRNSSSAVISVCTKSSQINQGISLAPQLVSPYSNIIRPIIQVHLKLFSYSVPYVLCETFSPDTMLCIGRFSGPLVPFCLVYWEPDRFYSCRGRDSLCLHWVRCSGNVAIPILLSY